MKSVVYLINLDESKGRLLSSSSQLEQLDIDFERVSAIDGRSKRIEDFECVDAKKSFDYLGRLMTGGEVGCYLSHIKCVERFLKSDADFCVVLEDDVKISTPSFMVMLHDVVESLPEDWEIINFGNQKNKIYSFVHCIECDSEKSSLVKAHYFPMTTTGICWSRKGAEAFLRDALPLFASVDRFLRYWQTRRGRGYCFMPPLVTTTGVESDINRKDKTTGLSFNQKMNYGLKKRYQMISDKLTAYSFLIKSKI